jgi:hypothetical protein
MGIIGGVSRLAIGWSLFNLVLAARLPIEGDFPWVPVVLLAALPLALHAFAAPIADSLHYGWMQQLASDRNQPTPPVVIKFLGWMLLAVQTFFLIMAG